MAEHVCPWWMGYLLANPLRRLFENPKDILGPYVKPGMTALDIGCAMGFFSLPMARMVGPKGRVVCVDLQDKMIRSLRRRAARAGLAERIDARICPESSLGLSDLASSVDFAAALHVVHEVPDPAALMREVCAALKPGGQFLVSEPKGHVSTDDFDATIGMARAAGLVELHDAERLRDLTVLFRRP